MDNNISSKLFPVSWDQFHRDSKALAWRLADKADWSAIIAVTRGGLVPSAIVARELNVRIIETICVTSYNPEHYEDNKIPMSVMLQDLVTSYKFGLKQLYYFNTYDGAGEMKEDEHHTYESGTTIRLTPIPSENWSFYRWNNQITDTTSIKEIEITEAKTIDVKVSEFVVFLSSTAYIRPLFSLLNSCG